MIVSSNIVLGKQLKTFEQDQIKNEIMLFNCDFNFAYINGGPITRNFLDNLDLTMQEKSKVVIDSRVHMLMEDWFPCIPGWHHDDVPRDKTNGQPEYINPSYRSKHALALYNGDICPTQFAIGTVEMSDPDKHEIVYKEWHKEVENHIKNNKLELVLCPSERVVYFDDRTFHQGYKAVKKGWRFFIRASWNTNRIPTNEIRRQVQVYLEDPNKGW